jgi:hypothetical protein
MKCAVWLSREKDSIKNADWTAWENPKSFSSKVKGRAAIADFIYANLDRHAYLQEDPDFKGDFWGSDFIYYIDPYINSGKLTLVEQHLDNNWVFDGPPKALEAVAISAKGDSKKFLQRALSEKQAKIIKRVDKYQKDEKALKAKLAKDLFALDLQKSQLEKTAQEYGLEL